MESYSYADSGDSSPDVDFDINQQPWEVPTRVKFMCSYGGKIHPRPHDNQLSYVGGETKILAVDRSVKFALLMPKLTALCVDYAGDVVCFKYQLPGEDLDALISVTNDDDLQHMMHEYDRLNRPPPATPARLRLFLFPVALTPVHSFGSTERERFVEDSRHILLQPTTTPANTELMFGLDKGGMPPKPSSGLVMSTTPDHQVIGDLHDIETAVVVDEADRIQKHIQDLQKLRINADQEQQPPAALYMKPSDDNLAAAAGYTHIPRIMTESATGYQISPDQQPPVYMIQTPASSSMYMARPVIVPTVNQGQGYYVQRMPNREQVPVYKVMASGAQAVAVATQQTTVSSSQQQFGQQNVATYTEGYRVVQSSTADAQAAVAYDNATTGGRQQINYYSNHGGVVAAQPQHPMQASSQQQYYHHQPMTALNQENAGNNVVLPTIIKELI